MSLLNNKIKFNKNVKLVISDVDETIADLYKPADPLMILELSKLLGTGVKIFFVTGQSRQSVWWRIVEKIKPELRHSILIASCGGADVWGTTHSGELRTPPLYSLYDQKMSAKQKKEWRKIIDQLISEFRLEIHQVMPVADFQEKAGNNPLAVMMEDRDSQITFEMVNAFNMTLEQVKVLGYPVKPIHEKYDLRHAIADRATVLLTKSRIPVNPKLAGVFALDFMLEGVSKTTAVKHLTQSREELKTIDLTPDDVANSDYLEIWGDKFSILGGSDRYMSEAVDPRVRSIDFRKENPDEFPTGYNIVVWNGNHHLHDGLLEYLQSR